MVAFVSIGVETSGLTVDNTAGVSEDDLLLLVTHSDDDITVTPPAGWTTGLRIATGGGMYGLQYSWKVASAADAIAANFTYTRDFSTASRSYIVCLSGNHATTPIRENQGTSPLSTAAASPLSVSLTGVTPSANDAVVYIGHIRPGTGTDRWSFAAPGSYTERMDFNTDGLSGTLATRDNVSAGATGTLTSTGTRTVGSSNGQFAGIVIAIAGAGGGSPTVSTVSSNSANEGTSIVHTVTLSAATTVAEVYAITLAGGTATGGGTDYTNTLTNGMFSNSVTVSGGNITVPIGVSSFTVTIPTTTDALVEGAETYTLTIGGTAGTGTINDLVVFTVNSVDLGSFTGFATFTITASATSGVDRAVNYATTDGTAANGVDYTAVSGTATILAGNLSVDVLVPIINTRKPDTDLVTTGWTVTGAANHSAALADNTDTSYTTSPDVTASPGPLKTQMLPTPLAAGTHTRQIRANYTTTPCDVKMSLLNSSDVVQGDSGWVSLTASIADYTLSITTTGSSTRFLFEVRATP